MPVYWPASAFPIPYAVDRRVVNLVPGGEHAIAAAFAVWTAVPEANVSFRPTGIVDGAKAGSDSQNTISVADDLFKGQGAIALTTNWHETDSGKLTEVDIQIDPSIVSSGYNVQQAVEHEVGHFLGLDHSPVISAVMYPYVGKTTIASTLDSDDRIGIANLYPRVDPSLTGGTLKGKVVGNNGGIFAAQVVALNDRGEPVSTGFTDANGDFVLQSVPDGTYRIYAEPLDGPVDPRNLDGVWRQAKGESFPTQFCNAAPLTVTSGKVFGNLLVNGGGAPVRLNPKWIGVSNHSNFSLSSMPVAIRPGTTMSIAVGGDGFTSGMTTFEVLSPGIRRISDFKYSSNFAWATFRASPDVQNGSTVIMVTSGNETAALTGALRVEGASPPPRGRLVHK